MTHDWRTGLSLFSRLAWGNRLHANDLRILTRGQSEFQTSAQRAGKSGIWMRTHRAITRSAAHSNGCTFAFRGFVSLHESYRWKDLAIDMEWVCMQQRDKLGSAVARRSSRKTPPTIGDREPGTSFPSTCCSFSTCDEWLSRRFHSSSCMTIPR